MKRAGVCWYFVVVAVALGGCSDDANQGGGGSGPVDWEGVSPSCKKWCEAFSPCTGGNPWPLSECAEGCRNNLSAGCETENDDMLSCQADYYAHECASPSGGCAPAEIAYSKCLYAQAECDNRADSCSCRVSPYGVELVANCHIVSGTSDGGLGGAAQGGAAEGGAGEGGSVSTLVVECNCIADGKLEHVCQQDALDCDMFTNCCPGF